MTMSWGCLLDSGTASKPENTDDDEQLSTAELASCQLYGIERASHGSQLFTIDLRAGEQHDLGARREHLHLAALAIQPTTRIIYALSEGNGSDSAQLYSVHATTGELELVAGTELRQVEGLAFRPTDAVLWASTAKGLFTIDPASGEATAISECKQRPAGGLAWSPDGAQLYIGQGNKLWIFEPGADEPCRDRESLPGVIDAFEVRPDGMVLAVEQGNGNGNGGSDQTDKPGQGNPPGQDRPSPGQGKNPPGRNDDEPGNPPPGQSEPAVRLSVHDLARDTVAATYEIPGERAHIEDIAWLGACGVPSPGGHAELIIDVQVDKTEVCSGEVVQVTVQAQHPEDPDQPVDVAVEGKLGTPQYVQITGEPGPRMIHVLASTADHYTDTAELLVTVVECNDADPLPIVYVRPNPYHPGTVDFQVDNAGDLTGTISAYVWDFGDGQTATTSVPYASHEYAAALLRDELYTVFQARLTVDRASRPDLTVNKTVSVWNMYAFNKKRGLIQPPVQSDERLQRSGSVLRGSVAITNLEDTPIALDSRWIEYQYCNPDQQPTAHAAEAIAVMVEAGTRLDHVVELPASIAAEGVCGVAVHLTGTAQGGRSVVASAYLEVQDNSLMRTPVLDTARLDILNQVAAAGLVADPNRITDEELYRLAMANLIEIPYEGTQKVFLAPPIGDQCQPGDTPPRAGLTCQATTEWEMVQPHIANALAGDTVLSSGCGMIGKLMQKVSPPQKFSHSGLMTRNFFELRHSTSAEERYMDYPEGSFGEPTDGFREDVLKFGWPGTITQSIDGAYNGQMMQDPESGKLYRIDAFTPEPRFCTGDVDLVFPIVIKPRPVPGSQQAVRAKLHAAVDQMNALEGHYRFFVYSNAAIGLDDTFDAPSSSGWAEGTTPTVCSSSIWLSMRKAGITFEEGLEPEDFQGGAMLDSSTVDGLYVYTEQERKDAGEFLYGHIYDLAYADAGWWGRLFTDAPDDIASQLVNCFGSDDCGQDAKDSDAWEEPGVGRAVSPDDMLFWDPPPMGVYGHNEPLVYRTGRFMRVHRWAASEGTGTIQGQVRNQEGNPVQGALVLVPSLPGVEFITDANGGFELVAIPAGSYEVKAQKLSDGLLLEASAVVAVAAGQVGTVTLTLQAPPRNKRRVRIFGNMHLVDHENILDNEVADVPFVREIDLDPFHTQGQFTISGCAGDELLVKAHFTVRLLADNLSVETSMAAEMFEETDCDNDDLDDQGGVIVTVAEDASQPMSLHLENNGDVDGGDTADISVTVQNARQN